jgi:uncharacterized membrane protein YfcA
MSVLLPVPCRTRPLAQSASTPRQSETAGALYYAPAADAARGLEDQSLALGVTLVDWMTVQVVAVLFVATLIRSAFGFGEALVAVPLLALLIPIDVAAPLAVLASITIAGLVLAQDWSQVHLRSAGWLALSTCFGIPIGLLLLTSVAEPIVKAVLAVIIIAFSAYSLASKRTLSLPDDRAAWLFGFGAGVLGGAYGMNGPPLVIYGALRGWSPQRFRATLQGYFLPASLLGMGGYWLAGLWTPAVTQAYLLSLPAVIVAIFAGRAVNRRLRGPHFLRLVHAGLIVIGAALLLQALAGY